MATGPKNVVLGRATYQATQIGNELMLVAKGVHPTTGFREHFEDRNLTASLPQFAFFFVKPSGIVLDVITPFQHQERFTLPGTVAVVQILDVDGKHQVPVAQVPVIQELQARMAAEVPPAEELSCAERVRQAVGGWAQNGEFDDDQALGEIIRGRPCDNGQLIALAQLLRAKFNVQLSISCSTPVLRIIDQICG